MTDRTPTAGVEIAVRIGMPLTMAEQLGELMPRFDPSLHARVRQQLWLRAILIEQLHRTNVAERLAFIERCDEILALLDPTDDEQSPRHELKLPSEEAE
jgi:hypothetical protein